MPIVRTGGLGELQKALATVDADLRKEVVEGLREAGRIVQEEATRRFGRYDRGSAKGFKTYVRAGSTVTVEQTLRKTTGLHPQWGELQMEKALLPAREAKLDDVYDAVEDKVGGLLARHGF